MPRTCFNRASIFAARSGNGGKTFEFRFTQEIYQTVLQIHALFFNAIVCTRRQRRRFFRKQPSKAFYEKAIRVIWLCG